MTPSVKIALFCGGRGGAALIREFLRNPDIELSLLVNAYDDGLSTGDMRELLPGMLGPSDFRKNLSYLVGPYSPSHLALCKVLEARLNPKDGSSEAAFLRRWAKGEGDRQPPRAFKDLVFSLDAATQGRIKKYLGAFFNYVDREKPDFRFSDCSLGNLIFAGCYLTQGQNFNRTSLALAEEFSSRANLFNVSSGENRILVALKKDGTFLEKEEAIVSTQGDSPIESLYLLNEALSEIELRTFDGLKSFGERSSFLAKKHVPVTLSSEARKAITECDILIYGPGTQHSSLFPSYLTPGIADAIDSSKARLKVFVSNIFRDHDISGWTARDILKKALEYLGDPTNEKQRITHAFINLPLRGDPTYIAPGFSKLGDLGLQGIKVILDNFENMHRPGAHSGSETVHRILEENDIRSGRSSSTATIYADVALRPLFQDLLVQEFQDIPWQNHLAETHLKVRSESSVVPLNSAGLTISPVANDTASRRLRPKEEGEIIHRWLCEETSEFLVTLTGDGEYRMSDVELAIEVMKRGNFGLLLGSRLQSRKRFLFSLKAAYGESRLLFSLSRAATIVLSFLFWVRHRLIMSDLLTGFRIYRRSFIGPLWFAGKEGVKRTPHELLKKAVREGVEVAEIPVTYRTYQGFTDVRWRVSRGLRILFSAP